MITHPPIPKADRIRRDLLNWIQQGQFEAGDRLPSERTLAESFSVNTRTIRRSLEQLTGEGVVEKRPRVGYFVRDTDARPSVTRLAVVLPTFMQDMAHLRSAIRVADDDGSPLPGDALGAHPFTGSVMAGVGRVVDHCRYACNTIFFEHDSLCSDIRPIIVAGGIKGLLMRPMMEIQRQTMEQLLETGVKIVLLSPRPLHLGGLNLVSIYVDQASPLHEAVEHLTALGHRRIVLARYSRSLHGPMMDTVLQTVLPRIDPAWRERFIQQVFNLPSGTDLRVLGSMLDRQPHPTAVIAQDEFLAWEVLRQCRLRGLDVPGDVSVVSLCNNAAAAFPMPLSSPATGQLSVQAAAMAMQQLLSLVEGESITGREIRFEAPIQWSESVAPPSQP